MERTSSMAERGLGWRVVVPTKIHGSLLQWNLKDPRALRVLFTTSTRDDRVHPSLGAVVLRTAGYG